MPGKQRQQNPSSDEMNIRSPEERYRGEGHAGTDPYTGKKPGRSPEAVADSSVEVSSATVEELIELPESAAERNRKEADSLARPSDERSAPEG